MSARGRPLLLLLGAALALVTMAGCESADGVEVHGSVGMYYGTGGGYYSPWYYGPGYVPPVIVNPYPPGYRPPGGSTRPPVTTAPRPTPLPASRSGGGGRRR
jgi:hypothetical protein